MSLIGGRAMRRMTPGMTRRAFGRGVESEARKGGRIERER
jgi:hypothetical protein